MVTLEKLLTVGSFGIMVGHLVHCLVILLASLGGFGLSLLVQFATIAFLGCWALITLTLVIHFRQDDHPILLNVMAQCVKTGVLPF
jgi:hypothetical protein